jgi:cell division protein FtsW
MLSSASMVKSQENFGTPYYYLKHQLLYGLLPGLFATWLTYKINYKKWKKFSFLFFVAAIIVLILVFLPGIGMKAGGAARWLHLGPISFQPSEMVKLGLIIYLAAWLGEKSKNFTNASETLLPFLIVVGSIMGLIVLQPNIGTAGTIGIIATVMYFSAGAPLWHIVTIAALGFGGFFSFLKFFSHASNRFQVFLHPELDPLGIGYQINQALLAIGSGGFFGRGLGQSIQKFNYLPEVIGDSIFAIIAEEIGFVGVVLLIGLFFMFAMRGFKIAKNSPDNFGKFLAVGITSWIVLQSFINISAISGLIPLTGVPLPLISYGASGLVVSLAAIGVLLNISRHA